MMGRISLVCVASLSTVFIDFGLLLLFRAFWVVLHSILRMIDSILSSHAFHSLKDYPLLRSFVTALADRACLSHPAFYCHGISKCFHSSLHVANHAPSAVL